jgi:hypothetical protein
MAGFHASIRLVGLLPGEQKTGDEGAHAAATTIGRHGGEMTSCHRGTGEGCPSAGCASIRRPRIVKVSHHALREQRILTSP